MQSIVKHHVRVFVSVDQGVGFFDDFDLAEFENDLEEFLRWFNSVCFVCGFNLDHYFLY